MNECRLITRVACFVLLLPGCINAPARMDGYALDAGFVKSVVEGAQFRHVVYKNRGADSAGVLNIYIEGDGNPWIRGRFIAKNPTSADTVMLRLMALDSAPAVYLGRPCYLGLHEDAVCDKKYWSSHRYSAEVVESMVVAVSKIAGPDRALNLFGHSGGGTLAVLMAARMPNVKAVITLAGNLDTDGWMQQHGYQPLDGSLNPRLQPPLPAAIRQLHLAGSKDKNVYPRFAESFVRTQQNAVFRQYPEQNHACCWQKIWPQVLDGMLSK